MLKKNEHSRYYNTPGLQVCSLRKMSDYGRIQLTNSWAYLLCGKYVKSYTRYHAIDQSKTKSRMLIYESGNRDTRHVFKELVLQGLLQADCISPFDLASPLLRMDGEVHVSFLLF